MSVEPTGSVIGGPPAASLSLLDLSSWIGYQLDNWNVWAESRDEDWLTWPTTNERWPTLGHLFIHACSPLHRYADQVVGDAPADDSAILPTGWIGVYTWAHMCQRRHYEVCAGLTLEQAGHRVRFMTRSAGELDVTVAEALTHACTHCFWHLSGIAHMLRLGSIDPPQRSDLILWAAHRHKLLAR